MRRSATRVAVLAGGSGTRFWPLGRARRPKQLLALDGDDRRPLVRCAVERVRGVGDGFPWVVAPAALVPALRRALPGLSASAFVAEPAPRNTCAAVVLAALHARATAPGATLVVVPADHHVAPPARYRAALSAMAARAAQAGTLMTLGLVPTEPATGYGWLRLGSRTARTRAGPIHQVERYVEKPSLPRAKRLLRAGGHLWNGGTFAFRPETFLAEAERLLPEVARPLVAAFAAHGTRRFAAALAKAYRRVPSVSVDFGVMERARGVEVLAADLVWDDLGSFDAVARHRAADARGNRVRGDAALVDADDCVVDADGGLVALLGVKDLIVVRTADAVLVARRGRGEDVRDVVARLKSAGREDLLA